MHEYKITKFSLYTSMVLLLDPVKILAFLD